MDTSPASREEREAYSRLRLLLSARGLLRGCVVEVHRTCGKAACRCREDRKYRHRGLYLGLRLEGKQRMVYVPSDWERLVREWVDRYSQIQDELERLSQCFLRQLRDRRR